MENLNISDDRIKEIIQEELARIELEEDEESFLRRRIAKIAKDEVENFGYKLRNLSLDNKSNLSKYTSELISKELFKFLDEEEIKKNSCRNAYRRNFKDAALSLESNNKHSARIYGWNLK